MGWPKILFGYCYITNEVFGQPNARHTQNHDRESLIKVCQGVEQKKGAESTLWGERNPSGLVPSMHNRIHYMNFGRVRSVVKG